MEDWMRQLTTYENGEYFSVDEVEQFFSDKKVVSKSEFMKELEMLIGYCQSNQRRHSFLDFEFDSDTGGYECIDCNLDVDVEKWASAQTLEQFIIGQSWVQAKQRKDLEPE